MNTEINSARKRIILHKSEAQMYNCIMVVGAELSSFTSIQPTDTANEYDTQPAPSPSSHQYTSPTTRLNNILPSLSSSSNWPLPNKLLYQKFYFLPTCHYYAYKVEFRDRNALYVCACVSQVSIFEPLIDFDHNQKKQYPIRRPRFRTF